MGQMTLEVELISAKGLKDVNFFTKMSVYAVVSVLGGDSHEQQKTKSFVSQNCGTHPTWNNFHMDFTVDRSLVQQSRLALAFKLICKRRLGDKYIGQVVAPIKELYDTMANPNSTMTFVAYHVISKPSSKPKGELHFSYKFYDKVAVSPAEPPFAWPQFQREHTARGPPYVPRQPQYEDTALAPPYVLPQTQYEYTATALPYPPPQPRYKYTPSAPPLYGYTSTPPRYQFTASAPPLYG
ncbi:protein SRC2-like [Pyrus x bretschneideri]|uniref:protein SRC2-like n=1 Tax=Pyrus x bretschneideri TaxID=225117 RepID=UPI002030213B|nr:protein SRC2-like [Pyrus x bretschneideri]